MIRINYTWDQEKAPAGAFNRYWRLSQERRKAKNVDVKK